MQVHKTSLICPQLYASENNYPKLYASAPNFIQVAKTLYKHSKL